MQIGIISIIMVLFDYFDICIVCTVQLDRTNLANPNHVLSLLPYNTVSKVSRQPCDGAEQ